MNNDPSPQLDYAPRPPPQRGARARRAAIVAGALLLALAIAWVTPRAFRRLQVTYWQRQCLDYDAPAGQVVHATDPQEVARLLAMVPYEGSIAAGHAFLVPKAYRNLRASQSIGTAFLHERRTPGGERRLVAIDLFSAAVAGRAPTTSPSGQLVLSATVLDLAGAAGGGLRPMVTLTQGDGTTIPRGPGDALRVFAGQPDPADPAHFTIDYALNGTRHTIDGWLKDDDVVVLESRD